MGIGKRVFIFLLIILLLALISIFYPYLTGNATNNQQQTNYQREPALVVTRIVDGDTIHVKIKNGSEEIIRFLGINNPKV